MDWWLKRVNSLGWLWYLLRKLPDSLLGILIFHGSLSGKSISATIIPDEWTKNKKKKNLWRGFRDNEDRLWWHERYSLLGFSFDFRRFIFFFPNENHIKFLKFFFFFSCLWSWGKYEKVEVVCGNWSHLRFALPWM